MLKRLLAFAALSFAASNAGAAPPHHAVFETSMGEILVELETAKAPASVAAFVAYARSGLYDGTLFHRVVKGFVVQGGEFAPAAGVSPGEPAMPRTRVAPFAPETGHGLTNRRGTIAFVRTRADGDDAAPQGFFFNLDDNDFLDHRRFETGAIVPTPAGPQAVPAGTQVPGHAVFGRVVKGLDAVDRIAAAPVRSEGLHAHLPVAPVTIRRVRILSAPR